MTVKITITAIDKIKNQQRRYSKYVPMGDSFGIILQEVEDLNTPDNIDDSYSCVIKNKDGEIWVENYLENGIHINVDHVQDSKELRSGDVIYLTKDILLNIKTYELSGRELFRSTKFSKLPIVIKVPVTKKEEKKEIQDQSNPVGHEIDGYYFEEILDYGNMGIVYKAIQKSLKRPVAIKTVAPQHLNDPTLVKRFMNMANLAWRLNHPYIVQIYDTGISHDFRMNYVVMEYVEGETLASMLKDKGNLDIEATCEIMCQLASALSFAHRQNIIHRDVNPSNIMITNDKYLKLIGLALSKIVDPNEEQLYLTAKGQTMGTEGYISPEQFKSAADVDYRTDLYSLGVIFYQCLCGCLPYDEDIIKDPSKYGKALKYKPKLAPNKVKPAIPQPLSDIVMKCLEPSPAKRYQKAEEIFQDIKVYTETQQLSVAQKRIRAMFPKTPEVPGYKFHVTFEPMEEIGGDFYDFVKLDDNKMAIVIGDVTGHGVEAAVVMGMVKSIVKLMSKNLDSPVEVLEYANQELHPDMDTTTFTTVGYGVLDLEKQIFSFARAGHNPLILYNQERDPKLTTFLPKGTIIGVPWALKCEEAKIQLQSGDIVIQYTDGITEAKSKAGEEYGFEKLCEVIELSNATDLEEVIQIVKDDVGEFSKGAHEDADDITILAFKVN